MLTFLCRPTVLHEGWIAELTPLHPAAAIKTQRSRTPLSKPKPPHSLAERMDSNDDVESTLPLTAWLSSSYTVACPPQTQCRISQGRQAGSWSETPPEQCAYEHKRTTETCPCTALGEAAFMKTHGQTLPGPSVPPSTSLSWAALQLSPLHLLVGKLNRKTMLSSQNEAQKCFSYEVWLKTPCSSLWKARNGKKWLSKIKNFPQWLLHFPHGFKR